ncbi:MULTISPECIES: ABC transporter substrate-binding protein [Acetobacter]|jgi:NitT/TauT family transport system substrate-binding protein|uniref:NitT/TauT family transport system substrate-binding protein n=1 Tax=Acetobacter lovaniensis TaxID=104100 RepID=A0A841QHG5_9PROT|nr:ABC transporter substrate-binding protein [Acetobacter lovaniensis]MBB6458549.1 NitT/TauT family transport system substrate-binding protein [Acetobacter lovaniensis]MCI1795368.1 ABC transporter substrate-binding protein [Acetobacter lovaniensis]MCP1240697.1 ABC transporter substrate-binding protein [Acetobacter lovaniensis]NHN82750.1 ABC transporter substrate-binding protein [Acetobacter lovaniensis]GBQ65218.1 nitrate/sulfonate/bicarbonate ABC transporter periplasmic protein [Acetobacter lo
MRFPSLFRKGLLASVCAAVSLSSASAASLKIGYSDWPGWVAWQVAIDKGWLKEAQVDADFQWFDYSASLDAFAAHKLDAVMATNGDALVTGANGHKGEMILVTDYSDGNDMVVAQPGIKDMQGLKGKSVAVEEGLVDHLLLLKGLEKSGMSEKDVKLVNTKTNETPQVLASGQVAAIAAWQPNSGQALHAVPGARPVFTSHEVPGLIYDTIAVDPQSLHDNHDQWQRLVGVWDRVVTYIQDPKTQPDALRIMAARTGVTPETYRRFLKGTHLLSLADGKGVFVKKEGLGSLYGSTEISDAFNVQQGVYKSPQNIDSYIDPSFTASVK